MTIVIDGKITSNKLDILKMFQSYFDEIYSLNYDALIDVLTEFKNKLVIEIVNKQLIIDFNAFSDVLDIICKDNSNITYTYK